MVSSDNTSGDVISSGNTSGDVVSSGDTSGGVVSSDITSGDVISSGNTSGGVIPFDNSLVVWYHLIIRLVVWYRLIIRLVEKSVVRVAEKILTFRECILYFVWNNLRLTLFIVFIYIYLNISEVYIGRKVFRKNCISQLRFSIATNIKKEVIT